MKYSLRLFAFPVVALSALACLFSALACSTTQIDQRGEYLYEDIIQAGMERWEVLEKLGAPIKTHKNKRTSKVAKDIFPIEESRKVEGTGFNRKLTVELARMSVWYNKNERVERILVHDRIGYVEMQ